jgi:hypothetical protein
MISNEKKQGVLSQINEIEKSIIKRYLDCILFEYGKAKKISAGADCEAGDNGH